MMKSAALVATVLAVGGGAGGLPAADASRTCAADSPDGVCTVHKPREYKRFGAGVANEEGNTVAYIKPCDLACCKKECDADPNCFAFSHRLNYCYLKDRCMTADDPWMSAKYTTYYATDCSDKKTVDKPTEVLDIGAKRDVVTVRDPRVGGSPSRTHKVSVDIEAARTELGLKPKNAASTATPKKIMVGNVWEQMAEGTRSLSSLMALAQITGREFVLPYVQNTDTKDTGTSIFKGNKVEPWGENPKFGTIFEPDEVRKCYPKVQKIHDSMDDVEVGDDVLGVYFVYPGDRDRDFKNIVPGVPSGIIDCSERALDTGLHVHQHDAFGNVPQMKKVICLDNDLRRRYTTRGLFEDLLGGYNTLYFINWRGVRLASHRVRLPDTDDKDPWGDFTASRECVFGGHHVFSKQLNGLVDQFVANDMAVATGGDFMLVHLRLEKVQVAPGMKDGTLIGRFIDSIKNIQKEMSKSAGLPNGQLIPVYLASDTLKSRSFRRGKMDMFNGFSEKFAEAVGTHTFDCVGHGHLDNSIACAAIELLMMSRAKHVVQLGASSFTRWGTEMMAVPSTTRMVNNGKQGVCVYAKKEKDMIKFGKVYSDLVSPMTFCK